MSEQGCMCCQDPQPPPSPPPHPVRCCSGNDHGICRDPIPGVRSGPGRLWSSVELYPFSNGFSHTAYQRSGYPCTFDVGHQQGITQAHQTAQCYPYEITFVVKCLEASLLNAWSIELFAVRPTQYYPYNGFLNTSRVETHNLAECPSLYLREKMSITVCGEKYDYDITVFSRPGIR